MAKRLREGIRVECDKGLCRVVGHVRYGHIVRDATGGEWLRKRDELQTITQPSRTPLHTQSR
jgi:hypothetical protein